MPTMVELWQIYFGLQRIRCLLIPKQRWLGGSFQGRPIRYGADVRTRSSAAPIDRYPVTVR